MSVEAPARHAKLRGLRDDFPYYACHCLKVRSESSAIVPFKLNAVQRRVHEVAERQMARAGRIRILVLKARQPGISTYVEGRFYWKTTRRTGARTFILTHRDQATKLHRASLVRGADAALAARHVGIAQDRCRRLRRRAHCGEGGQGVAAG